jgi:hypothetical protein
MQIHEKFKQQQNCQKIEITNFKEKRLCLMSKSFKSIIIPTIKHRNNSNIKFI